MSAPSYSTLPACGRSKRANTLINVDLPAPLGPMIKCSLEGANETEISEKSGLLAAGKGNWIIRKERLVAGEKSNLACRKHENQKTYCRRRKRKINTGTPTAEVRMPIGNSAGRTTSSARRSAICRNVGHII